MLPVYNERRLTWDDAVALADHVGVCVELRAFQRDALLTARFGPPRIVVSKRLHISTWGVFSIVHELVHHLIHPGPRQFYLCSPGWHQKTESQANVAALLALWPRPAPYPRILQIAAPAPAFLEFTVALVESSRLDFTDRWTTQRLVLQRYAA